jgi:hypothetical protein
MNKVRVLINASPRSGHTWLQYLLVNSLKESQHINLGDTVNEFVVRSNNPVILHARFDDILQTSILRSPEDIIASIVTKTMGGLGNTVTSGVPMPHEYNELPPLERLVADQFGIYKLWSSTLIENLDRVKAFTFDQITNDPGFVINSVMKNFGADYDVLSNDKLSDAIDDARVKIFQHNKGDIGFNNPLPVEKKPDIYYEIKEIAKNHPQMSTSLKLYSEYCNIILEEQSKWK